MELVELKISKTRKSYDACEYLEYCEYCTSGFLDEEAWIVHIEFQLTLVFARTKIKIIYFSLVLLDLSGSNGHIYGCEGWLV